MIIFKLNQAINWGFPGVSAGKESACNAGDMGLILGRGRFPGEETWVPTAVFSPGEFHGQRSLAGYSPWGSQRVGHNWATNTFKQVITFIYRHTMI